MLFGGRINMTNKTNIGEAILILGVILFMLSYEIRWWGIIGMLLLIVLSISTWEFVHHPKELKDLVKAQIDEIKTRTIMTKTQAKLFIAQALNYARGIKQ